MKTTRSQSRSLLSVYSAAVVVAALFLGLGTARALNPNHECAFCHTLHDAPGTKLTSDVDVEVLCLTCHGPAGMSVLKADIHINDSGSDYDPFLITCLQCHDPHSDRTNWLGSHSHPDSSTWTGTNIKLLGFRDASGVAVIQTTEWDDDNDVYVSGERPIVFEQLGDRRDADLQIHSFADADQDGNGVKDGACETCHTQTRHHCNGDPDNSGNCDEDHNTGRTCTQCHGHDTNFQRN